MTFPELSDIKTGIYMIRSIIHDDRIYIGSSLDINKRWRDHKYTLKEGCHKNPKLQHHFDKYGISDLVFFPLQESEKACLLADEQFFIDSLNPWFNIIKIATANGRGRKASWETRRLQSIAKKGKPSPKKGVPMRDEQRQKLIDYYKTHPALSYWQGRKMSEEQRRKLSESHKGIKQTPESIKKRTSKIVKSVEQFDLNGVLIKEYESITEASRQTGVSYESISKCCNGHIRQCCGYIWRFKILKK